MFNVVGLTVGVLDSVAITAEMLKPLVDGVTANVAVILPVGITIMAIMIGIGLIPKIISKFKGN